MSRERRGEIPSEYIWKDLPGIRARFPMPGGWFFWGAGTTGSFTFALTRESIQRQGIFTTGLTVYAFLNCRRTGLGPAEAFARGILQTLPIVTPVSGVEITQDGPLTMHRQFFTSEERYDTVPSFLGELVTKRFPPTHYYYLTASNRATDTAYMAYFETPESLWAEDSKIARIMIKNAVFDKRV